jgi:hypothetical protein
MKYPESIYAKYEIEEKDICGERHYCLVRVWSFFGIKCRSAVKVSPVTGETGYTDGRRWHRRKSVITSCVRDLRMQAEWGYEWKMTK